jgi:putative transposase
LNEHLFDNLHHARSLIAEWYADFNHNRTAHTQASLA